MRLALTIAIVVALPLRAWTAESAETDLAPRLARTASLGSIFDKRRALAAKDSGPQPASAPEANEPKKELKPAATAIPKGAAAKSAAVRQAAHQQPVKKTSAPTKAAPKRKPASGSRAAAKAGRSRLASNTSARTPGKSTGARRAMAQVPINESPYLTGEMGLPREQAPMDFGGPEDIPEPPSDHPLLDKWCKGYERLKEPVEGNSWLARPLSIGAMVGGIWGDEMIRDRVDSNSGTLGLFLLGWDATKYNGFDVRLGGCAIDVINKIPPLNPRNNDFRLFDFGWLWYPWGDSRLRPFTRLGLGLQRYTFLDDTARRFDVVVPAIPIGIGAKFLFNRHVAFRMELVDNIGLGSGLDLETMHQNELSFGFEFRFGGFHKSYWPWDPGRFPW